MDNNNPSTNSGQSGSGQGNNFFSGFLIGVLVGAAVVFLLGTKKGKRVWKAISEEGIGNISDLLEKAEKTEDLYEVMEEKDEVHVAPKREFVVEEKAIEKPRVRRFFRGISRRVN